MLEDACRGIANQFDSHFKQGRKLLELADEVAEWLRRWTANPLCSARVGSNPILVGGMFSTRDVMMTSVRDPKGKRRGGLKEITCLLLRRD